MQSINNMGEREKRAPMEAGPKYKQQRVMSGMVCVFAKDAVQTFFQGTALIFSRINILCITKTVIWRLGGVLENVILIASTWNLKGETLRYKLFWSDNYIEMKKTQINKKNYYTSHSYGNAHPLFHLITFHIPSQN